MGSRQSNNANMYEPQIPEIEFDEPALPMLSDGLETPSSTSLSPPPITEPGPSGFFSPPLSPPGDRGPLSPPPTHRARDRAPNDLPRPRQASRSPRPPDLKILIAPSGFKEALGPEDVAAAIETGLRRVVVEDTATVTKLPLHDGGEGFCKALIAAQDLAGNGVELKDKTVVGPIGDPVDSHYGIITGEDHQRVGVLDMAAAAGLRLVPPAHRDPTKTTTFGVGQLIQAALDDGCTKIVIGCGDSGTSDGGAGMLQALGARLLDTHGEELPVAGGGGSLVDLAAIDLDGLHPRLRPRPAGPGSDDKNNEDAPVTIEAVCNINNVLTGRTGVARVYGPQKGATPTQVETLSTALERLAAALSPHLPNNINIGLEPGSGASGGLGAGLLLLHAQLRPRSTAINEYFHIDATLDQRWDFVFTAEGSLDAQSTKGKMTGEVARRASERGAQVSELFPRFMFSYCGPRNSTRETTWFGGRNTNSQKD